MSVLECTNCGQANNESLTKCAFCGANLSTGEVAGTPESLYIGEEDSYYHARFAQIRGTDSGGWNFAAFFFTVFWLVYRKMYVFAVVAAAAIFSGFLFPPLFFLAIVVKFGLGIMGNDLYMKRIDRLAAKYDKLPISERARHVKRWGGTSAAAVIIAAVIYIAGFFAVMWFVL